MTSVRKVWTSGWAQAGIAVLAFVVAATLLWWRGPDWGSVLDAFSLVIWTWIILAFALNVVPWLPGMCGSVTILRFGSLL